MRIFPAFFVAVLLSLWIITASQRDDATRSVELGRPDSSALQAQLAERWSRRDPRSTEALELQRSMRRLRQKTVQRHPREENPGVFREALAQIKSRADGTTYEANYKLDALRTAKRRPHKGAGLLPWTERGPGNVSGRARAIVADAADPSGQTWFVATVGGGIWKTSSAGSSWQNKSPELGTLSTTCIAQCVSQPLVLYVGTGMGYGRIVDLEGSGIWKSIDGGESWSQLASTAFGQILTAINRIVVDPADPDVVVACSNTPYSHLGTKGGSRVSGIFRSVDGGVNWTQTFDSDAVFGTATDNRVQQIVADPANFQRLYATVNEVGVIRSDDGGQSWTVSVNDFALVSDIGNPPGGGLGLSGISVRTEMAVAASDPQRLYAAVERPRGIADLYMSANGGDSWDLLPDTGVDPNWFNNAGISGSLGYTAGWFDNTIAVDPRDEDVVFVGGVNMYRIEVDPVAKTRLASPMAWWIPNGNLPVVHADHHWIATIPQGVSGLWLVGANDGGVALSTDGGTSWTNKPGIGSTQFYGADKAPGADRYFGGMQDNGTWMSGLNPTAGTNWSFLLGGDGFEVAWHGSDPNLMLYGYQFNGIVRSTDGGASWTAVPEATFPTVLGAAGAPFITKFANNKLDPDLVFIVGSTGVRRSDDFGATWTNHPVSGNWLGHRPFDNVEISEADPQVVWISSRMGIDPGTNQIGGIHVSTDGGLAFSDISANFPPNLWESSGIGTHPTDGAVAYFLFSAPGYAKIVKTVDFGQNFVDITGFAGGSSTIGFPDVAVFSLLVMPYDSDVIWAGTEIGLFISDNGGASWQFASDGLPHVAIFQLRIVEDQVLVATQGRGIWSVTLPELQDVVAPVVTLAPRLLPMVQRPTGELPIEVDLRSPYDSTLVFVNDVAFPILAANDSTETLSIPIPITQSQTIRARVVAFRDGRAYPTPEREADVYPITALNRYEYDMEDTGRKTEFNLSGFNMVRIAGFSDRAAHTAHKYAAGIELSMQLRNPIRVANANALMTYRDICLVEKGAANATHYTHPNFWDYVIVEATNDGIHWIPLIDGYDSRAHPVWSNAYDQNPDGQGGSNTTGTPAMYVSHEIDLHDSFDPGELIFLRFRLYSDSGVTAWGWAIDDLLIQPQGVGLGEPADQPPVEPAMQVTELRPNTPNPFNPRTTIAFSLARRSRVRLGVYDLAGRLVQELVAGESLDAGPHARVWEGVDGRGRAVASGVYLYRLSTPDFERSRKMVLVR
jgi:hypothetical protein